jgi:serine/threonine protein kinase
MVLMKGGDYDFTVDMWSLGCIAAELYNGIPLFLASSQNELIEFHSLYCGGFDRGDVRSYDNYKPFLDMNTPSG